MESPRRSGVLLSPQSHVLCLLPLRREAFPLSCNAKPGQAGGFRYRIGSICQIHPEIRPKRLGLLCPIRLDDSLQQTHHRSQPDGEGARLGFPASACRVCIHTDYGDVLSSSRWRRRRLHIYWRCKSARYRYQGDICKCVRLWMGRSTKTLQDGRWKLPTAYIHCKAGQRYYYPNWNIHYHK